MSARRIDLKVGDIFEIPLPSNQRCYSQLLLRHAKFGFLVRIFDVVAPAPLEVLDEITSTDQMFPPVFVGLQATVRSGRWKHLGNRLVVPFSFPQFRKTVGTKPGTYSNWWLWNGTVDTFIGKLPPHLRTLELQCVWGDEALEERILAGTYRGDFMI